MDGDVSARYIVNDVDEAIRFYGLLGFKVVMHPRPEFAMLSKGSFRLYLTKPGEKTGGGAPMPDGSVQSPGGWNRISIEVAGLEGMAEKLRKEGCRFRNEMAKGVGGSQILLMDPSGNLIELFEYFRAEKK